MACPEEPTKRNEREVAEARSTRVGEGFRSQEPTSRLPELRDLRVAERAIDSLRPRRKNPRTHSAKSIR